MKILAFDVWGRYAHFKKIYATTSAISYLLPPKTSIYGMIGAILGLEKNGNEYLRHFQDKQCLIGIQIVPKPGETNWKLKMQRIATNLRPVFGPLPFLPKKGIHKNRNPTNMEFVYEPRYRIYVTHSNEQFFDNLRVRLKDKTCVYTPTLGLAGLLANFAWESEWEANLVSNTSEFVPLLTVVPRRKYLKFELKKDNEIVEQSLYAVEMDTNRNVTERDDILLDRTGRPIFAKVTDYYYLPGYGNIVLF